MKLANLLPKSTNEAIEITGEKILQQVDNAGYHLLKLGITDKVNRHNCIAILITEDQRIRGEIARLQMKLDRHKAKIRHTKRMIGTVLDHLSEVTPSTLEKPLGDIRAKIGI